MTRTTILLVGSAMIAATTTTPALADDGIGSPAAITVTAPRNRQMSSDLGAPIETVSTSVKVNYKDLNLKTTLGQKELRERVNVAADNACSWLDELYPVTADNSPDCIATALNSAKGQINAAIAAARA